MLGGLGTLAWQIYTYLRVGEWDTFSLIDLVQEVFPASAGQWVLFPTDWIGLHEVLSWMPISLFFIGIAALMMTILKPSVALQRGVQLGGDLTFTR